jgi:hypothetical protein
MMSGGGEGGGEGGREGGREGGWGQKVLSWPSADSFAVGRRQKEQFLFYRTNSYCLQCESKAKRVTRHCPKSASLKVRLHYQDN